VSVDSINEDDRGFVAFLFDGFTFLDFLGLVGVCALPIVIGFFS